MSKKHSSNRSQLSVRLPESFGSEILTVQLAAPVWTVKGSDLPSPWIAMEGSDRQPDERK
jgi:hypothetical protein